MFIQNNSPTQWSSHHYVITGSVDLPITIKKNYIIICLWIVNHPSGLPITFPFFILLNGLRVHRSPLKIITKLFTQAFATFSVVFHKYILFIILNGSADSPHTKEKKKGTLEYFPSGKCYDHNGPMTHIPLGSNPGYIKWLSKLAVRHK